MTSQEYNYELRIPKDRVAVLIGKKGQIKKEIETTTKTRLNIDSKESNVSISGKNALDLFVAKEIIEAIGRGFNPDFAKLLLKGDYVLEIVNIKDFAGKSKNNALRLKGRVIGKEGKSRKTIEALSDTYIAVYGKTISIIGKSEDAFNARKAVESLLRGAPHGNVYKALEKNRKKRKEKEIKEENQID